MEEVPAKYITQEEYDYLKPDNHFVRYDDNGYSFVGVHSVMGRWQYTALYIISRKSEAEG